MPSRLVFAPFQNNAQAVQPSRACAIVLPTLSINRSKSLAVWHPGHPAHFFRALSLSHAQVVCPTPFTSNFKGVLLAATPSAHTWLPWCFRIAAAKALSASRCNMASAHLQQCSALDWRGVIPRHCGQHVFAWQKRTPSFCPTSDARA